ncbi:MAG: DUF134 domain-containing protein [Ruminiclostridium sp.]|nr:DUF134 domain-containing protein [Ruminiclostridium sp.]
MPRPVKSRRICGMPEYCCFAPQENCSETVVLTIDEYETIRLIDYMGQSQEQCAAQMEVARTTVTAIYDSARRKIADCIVNGKRLEIAGGNFRIAENTASGNVPKKGNNTMRIAVTYENGNIFQHFGRTEQFKLYDIENGAVKSSEVVGTNGAGHGALAGFLRSAGADMLICGGIGGGAQMAMQESGIALYAGNSGSADDAVNAYLAGTLAQNTEANCDHHGHEHGEGHACGEHGCGHH